MIVILPQGTNLHAVPSASKHYDFPAENKMPNCSPKLTNNRILLSTSSKIKRMRVPFRNKIKRRKLMFSWKEKERDGEFAEILVTLAGTSPGCGSDRYRWPPRVPSP
jgi:hypothetical protein